MVDVELLAGARALARERGPAAIELLAALDAAAADSSGNWSVDVWPNAMGVRGVAVTSPSGFVQLDASDERAARALLDARLPHATKLRTVGKWKPALQSAAAQHGRTIARDHDQLLMTHALDDGGPREGRWAEAKDIPRLREYRARYNAERNLSGENDWPTLIAKRRVAVLDEGGEVASVLLQRPTEERFATLIGTYTFPEWRRRGCSARLTRFVLGEMKREGRAVVLFVDSDNVPAIALYRRIGFETVDTTYVAYLEGRP